MDILIYLLESLQQSNEVGITDLGSFYKKKHPGRYDKEKKSFLPPKHTLHFTTDVKDAQAFETFISTRANISKDDAKNHIMQFVADVKQKLALAHEAELENIGRLFYAEEDNLSFKVSEKFNDNSEFFGLPSVDDTENLTEEVQFQSSNQNDKPIAADETESAPIEEQPATTGDFTSVFPIVENIELDEVKTDFENTLAHLDETKNDQIEASESNTEKEEEQIIELDSKTQSEENVDDEPLVNIAVEDEATPIVEPPLSGEEKEAIFSNTDIDLDQKSESASTKVVSESLGNEAEEIVEVPQAVLEQHEEHPNKFGTDPMQEPIQQSIWPKVIATLAILLLIGGLVYFFQPNLFNRSSDPTPKVVAPIDSNILQEASIDTVKFKQDSTVKADSILKANLITTTGAGPTSGNVISNNLPLITYEVIAASYKTEKSANNYIKIMNRKGYDAKIANMTGPWKKVSIASFDNEQEAKKQLYILQKKLKGNGFYVQKIKNP